MADPATQRRCLRPGKPRLARSLFDRFVKQRLTLCICGNCTAVNELLTYPPLTRCTNGEADYECRSDVFAPIAFKLFR